MNSHRRLRTPYCPLNGCFMFNGASGSCNPITCPNCKNVYNNDLNLPRTKLCTVCKYCYYCCRIGKRFYETVDKKMEG